MSVQQDVLPFVWPQEHNIGQSWHAPEQIGSDVAASDSERLPANQKLTTQRKIARIVASLCIGGGFGAGLAANIGTESSIGPVEIESKATMGTGVVLQFATEAVRFDTPIPGNPGLVVTPTESRYLNSPEETLAQLGDVEAIATSIATRTYKDILVGGALGTSLALGLGAPLLDRAGSRTRDERSTVKLATSVGTIGMMALFANTSNDLIQRDWTPVKTVFNGQELNGIQVSGGLATMAVERLQQNEAHYAKGVEILSQALKPVVEEDIARGYNSILFASDWHIGSGTAQFQEVIINEYGVNPTTKINLMLDAGDTGEQGIEPESLWIDVKKQRVYNHIDTVIAVAGDHDSHITERQLENAGAILLDGETIEVDGLTIAAFNDPNVKRMATPTTLRNPEETVAEFNKRVAEQVAEEKPKILLTHKRVPGADEFVDLELTGHMHTYHYQEDGSWIQAGTSGGKSENQPTFIDPPKNPVSNIILYKNPYTNKIVGHRTIAVQPNLSVEISEYIPRHPTPVEKIYQQGSLLFK